MGIGKIHLLTIVSVWLLIHLLLFQHYGLRGLWDADGYVKGADYLLEHGRLIDVHHLFYIVHISVIAISRWFFPGEILPDLFLQCILSGVATLSLYKAASNIFQNSLAGLLASIIYLVWWDNIQWNVVTMTESLSGSTTCILILLLVEFKGLLKDYLWILLILIIELFLRPTGVVIIVGVIFFILSFHWRFLYGKTLLKFLVIGSFSFSSLVCADRMFAHWDFTDEYRRGNIITYVDRLEGDILYNPKLRIQSNDLRFVSDDQRPILKVVAFIYYNPIYFIKTGCLKVWYLISALRPYYSTLHNSYSIIWYSAIYIFFYLGFSNAHHHPIKVFTMTVIIVNCLLIAISSVDWDNRFYIPMEPGIVLFSGGGLAYILNRFNRRYLNKTT